MADINVKVIRQLDGSFTYDPVKFTVFCGQTVAFHSAQTDAVICFENEKIFGSKSFILPQGRKLTLVVQDFADEGLSPCTVSYGTLDLTQCPGVAAGGPGEDSGPEVNPPFG